MPSVKKSRPISFEIIDKVKAMAALEIHVYYSYKEMRQVDAALENHVFYLYKRMCQVDSSYEDEQKQKERIEKFDRTYHHSYWDVIVDIWKWYSYLFRKKEHYSLEELYSDYVACISELVNKEPMKLRKYDTWDSGYGKRWEYVGNDEWVFNGYVYEVKGFYSDDETKLLILENFDNERRYFEKLNAKFNQTANTNTTYERPRIPESIRIEVWRRDSGKCARCSSREKLEYDHIVPISKGGSNTARNIELLCEKCNRSKSNNVV
jgi:hypothetical protein